MKKLLMLLCVMTIVSGKLLIANAELIDRGGGLIYDTVQNITWLQDANYAHTSGYDLDGLMNRNDAFTWADNLEYGGYDNWRLPSLRDKDGNYPDDVGYDLTATEFGYLYYVELGNPSGGPLVNVYPFTNIPPPSLPWSDTIPYWSSTEIPTNPDGGRYFLFNSGQLGGGADWNEYYAWAVRDGDVIPAPQYTIIDLGTLGGNKSDALSITNLGQVVGTAKDENGVSNPFLYSDGEMINLSIIGEFTGGMATDINDYGQIIGWASSEIVLFGFPPSDKHAFIYSEGAMIDPGVLRGENGIPSSINNNGLITGEYFFSGATHSFIYSISENDMDDLGTLGGNHSYGYGINEAGQVVGAATTSNGETHAFLYTDGSMSDLGTAEGNLSQAYDINNYTQIIGYFSPVPSAGDSRHPFLYDGDTMIGLGTLGGNSARATAINDAGHIVGWSITGNSETHAFIYKSGIIYDLSDLIPQDSNWDFLIEAWDINNSGQIVGNGRVDLDGDGMFDEIHAFLLTPVHETTLLGWDYPNGLITINPVTAGYTINFDSNRQFEATAYDPENKLLYAIENLGGDNLLVSIDYKNELITDIGYVVGYTEITSMTYDRTTSTLFAIDQATRTLLEIDPQTGAGTPISNYTLGTSNALAAHPLTGELYLGWGVDPSYLTIIDKTTGELTYIGSMVIIESVRSLEFHPTTFELYGSGGLYNSGGQLFTVNLTTGAVNPIGPLRQVVSLAFIDQPIGDTDGDGIPDDVDACPNSDLSETVIIDSWDTGVENVRLADGCTISDLISECADGADNHGGFVSSVSHTTNSLKKEGIISGKEKGMIQKGAARAAIP